MKTIFETPDLYMGAGQVAAGDGPSNELARRVLCDAGFDPVPGGELQPVVHQPAGVLTRRSQGGSSGQPAAAV